MQLAQFANGIFITERVGDGFKILDILRMISFHSLFLCKNANVCVAPKTVYKNFNLNTTTAIIKSHSYLTKKHQKTVTSCIFLFSHAWFNDLVSFFISWFKYQQAARRSFSFILVQKLVVFGLQHTPSSIIIQAIKEKVL